MKYLISKIDDKVNGEVSMHWTKCPVRTIELNTDELEYMYNLVDRDWNLCNELTGDWVHHPIKERDSKLAPKLLEILSEYKFTEDEITKNTVIKGELHDENVAGQLRNIRKRLKALEEIIEKIREI